MTDDKKYISSKEARKILGVTAQTLRNWSDEGKIVAIRSPHKMRLYDLESVHNIAGITAPIQEKKSYTYCRVSSQKQRDDLERQKDFFRHEYPNHELVTDIGSGINWKRKGFRTILERIMCGDVEELVVAHRDRLCRFAFEFIEWICEVNSTKLTVLDISEGESKSKELADDILSIIHVYSCREMGKRRYANKKNTNLPNEKTT